MDQLNACAYTGAKMVFGPLGDADMLRGAFGASGAYVFAISVTATIILISSLSSLLYYWGVLQKVVAGHGLGDDEDDADQRQRKSRRREQYFPRANRSRARDQTVPAENDAERSHGADDDRHVHDRHRRDGRVCGDGRIERRTYSHGFGAGRAGGFARRENHVSRNGTERDRRALSFRYETDGAPTASTRSAAARAKE